MTRPAPIPCSRFLNCGKSARSERWDERVGAYKPVCADHARDATPMELRPLQKPAAS